MPESDLAKIVGDVCDHRPRMARQLDSPETSAPAVIGMPVATLIGNATSSGFEQEKPDWGRSGRPIGIHPPNRSGTRRPVHVYEHRSHRRA